MTSSKKNLPYMIRSELLEIARKRKVQFEQVLTHYAIERFLYRLSISKYKNRFLLKGAMLFTALQLDNFRPTRDLDLLGFGDNSIDAMKEVFQDLLSIEYENDGIKFAAQTLIAQEIRSKEEYTGVRLKFFATLHTAKIPVQIDIGIGDSVFPAPKLINFPTLLELPAPRLKSYTIETVVAEKLETIVRRGRSSSRMKDYFDLNYLSKHFEFHGEVLAKAIKKTFVRRKTILRSDPPEGLSKDFYNDSAKSRQWESFCRQIEKTPSKFSLKSIVEEVAIFTLPPLHAALVDGDPPGTWSPNGPWRNKT